jgi:oligoribonuclease NrnB/cAMP/cGMP phosphodiesterase (DHH superfamily)
MDWKTLEASYLNQDWKTNFKDKLKPQDIDVVISHGKCTDGFMAATIAKKWFDERHQIVTFYQGYYNIDYHTLIGSLKNKKVFICDFSFVPSVFDQIIETTNGNVFLLDHHKTARRNLDQEKYKSYCFFDMKHSGAFLAWSYFYPDQAPMSSIYYVEDHDLWKHTLPWSREFSAYVHWQPFDFVAYEKLFDDTYVQDKVIPMGTIMWNLIQNMIAKMACYALPSFIQLENRFYFAACLQSGILQSELGDYLLSYLPGVNFAMIYMHHYPYNGRTEGTRFSLRSTDDHTDVETIAKQYGGGHRNSSAGSCPFVVNYPAGATLLNVCDLYYHVKNHLYEMEVQKKKLLLLNTDILQREMVQYLMQSRFETEDENEPRSKLQLPNYQEGMYWMRERCQNPNLDDYYHAAVAWVYDGTNYLLTLCSPWIHETNLEVEQKKEKKQRMRHLSEGADTVVDYSFSYKKVQSNLYELKSNVSAYELLCILVQAKIFNKIKH